MFPFNVMALIVSDHHLRLRIEFSHRVDLQFGVDAFAVSLFSNTLDKQGKRAVDEQGKIRDPACSARQTYLSSLANQATSITIIENDTDVLMGSV
jgi:hypothetical protein